ncbi:MAG: hypothetical protein ACP5G1_02725 [Nanopusillaceae archaeon]
MEKNKGYSEERKIDKAKIKLERKIEKIYDNIVRAINDINEEKKKIEKDYNRINSLVNEISELENNILEIIANITDASKIGEINNRELKRLIKEYDKATREYFSMFIKLFKRKRKILDRFKKISHKVDEYDKILEEMG